MQFGQLKRREFISLFGSAAAWPFAARAQERTASVGALMVLVETSPESMRLAGAFEAGLAAAGWRKGRNLDLVYRWGATNPELLARQADELLRARPNVLLAFGTPTLIQLHKATTTIPIVFAAVSDPVGQGFVASISRPGGNLTGFSNFDPEIGGKWLQVLRDVAPCVHDEFGSNNPSDDLQAISNSVL